jgi:hypothetical protein
MCTTLAPISYSVRCEPVIIMFQLRILQLAQDYAKYALYMAYWKLAIITILNKLIAKPRRGC